MVAQRGFPESSCGYLVCNKFSTRRRGSEAWSTEAPKTVSHLAAHRSRMTKQHMYGPSSLRCRQTMS